MAISLSQLVELGLFKFDQHFPSAGYFNDRHSNVPARGIWKTSGRNQSGPVETLMIRLGDDYLEVRTFPAFPGLSVPVPSDMWLFEVVDRRDLELRLHLIDRLDGSGIRAGLTPTGGDVAEADIPPEVLDKVETLLRTI